MSEYTHQAAPHDTFQEAYHTLKHNAQKLETEHDIDIDELMTVVESSISAYKVCQKRIEAVEAALKDAFDKLEN